MNPAEEEITKRFIRNEMMAKTIKGFLIRSFEKKRPERDVYMLAAQTLSKEMLEEAWADMERMDKDTNPPKEISQVGM